VIKPWTRQNVEDGFGDVVGRELGGIDTRSLWNVRVEEEFPIDLEGGTGKVIKERKTHGL